MAVHEGPTLRTFARLLLLLLLLCMFVLACVVGQNLGAENKRALKAAFAARCLVSFIAIAITGTRCSRGRGEHCREGVGGWQFPGMRDRHDCTVGRHLALLRACESCCMAVLLGKMRLRTLPR